MGYDLWIRIRIKPFDCDLLIKNAHLNWGKFHIDGDKDKEIQISEINKITINRDKTAYICSCGRSCAPSGTEGGFDIYDKNRGEHIATFYWDCPRLENNSTTLSIENSRDYTVKQDPNPVKQGGAIEDVNIDLYLNLIDSAIV